MSFIIDTKRLYEPLTLMADKSSTRWTKLLTILSLSYFATNHILIHYLLQSNEQYVINDVSVYDQAKHA